MKRRLTWAIINATYTPAVKGYNGPRSPDGRLARTRSPTFHIRVWSMLPIGKAGSPSFSWVIIVNCNQRSIMYNSILSIHWTIINYGCLGVLWKWLNGEPWMLIISYIDGLAVLLHFEVVEIKNQLYKCFGKFWLFKELNRKMTKKNLLGEKKEMRLIIARSRICLAKR